MFSIGMNELASFGPVVRFWVLTPAFHFNILHEFLPTVNKHACKFAECLRNDPNAQTKEGFNVLIPASLCAIDIICESSMGTEINLQDYQNAAYVHAVDSAIELVTHRYLTAWLRPDFLFRFSWTKYKLDKHLKYVNDFSDKVINERRDYLIAMKEKEKREGKAGPRRKLAFLDLLLEAQMEGTEPITQKNVRDNVNTVIFGGYDTIATAMSWLMLIFGQYPDIQARAVEELVEIFGDSGRAPTVNDLASMKYLERCFKETLRLYPSIPFLERAAHTDVVLDDYVVPAGCTLSFNGFLLHRDPEFWPDPEKFDPDRFLPENSQGQKFAMMEAKSVLSTVLRRYRLEAARPREEAIFQVGMVLRPKNGIHIRVFDREDFPFLRIEENESNMSATAKFSTLASVMSVIPESVLGFNAVAISLILPLLLFLWLRSRNPFIKAVNKLPGPPTWPVIGDIAGFIPIRDDHVKLFQKAMKELAMPGLLTRVWVFRKAQVLICGARDAEMILKDMKHHVKSDNYLYLREWMGQGLLTSRVLTPAFHFNILHEFLPIFSKHALKLTQRLADEPAVTSKQGFNIFPYSSLCSLDIICGGKRRLAFLDLLLTAEADGSQFMTQKDIRDQVSTFMFEGHDTVSTATCWVLFILGTYPDAQRRVVEELEEVFGDSGRAPEMADLANLKYLERCIKETLRLYPSVPFFERNIETNAKIGKHDLPAGCFVTFMAYALHRDPEFWPDPEKFDPDRFLP
ncbi:hypothetical protein B566_EDAN014755, partial [Ephemera danica]